VFNDYTVNKLTSKLFYFASNTCRFWFNFCVQCTLIERKPAFSGRMFRSLEIPFKTGFAVCMYIYVCIYMYVCMCIYIYIYIYTLVLGGMCQTLGGCSLCKVH